MKKESKNMSLTSANSAKWRNNPYYKFHKGSKKRRTTIEEAAKNVDFTPDVEAKDLNPILWNEDGTLKPEMRAHLLKIAKEFYEFLDVEAKLKDVTITGSMANHNWTDFSDIDLHLLLDFKDVDKNVNFVRDMMDMKKALWGLRHDIKIKDFDVELYAQDVNQEQHSSGVFSLKNNDWISKPTKENVVVDKESVRKKADTIARMIDALEGVDDDDDKIEASDELREKIRKMRQAGLDKGGEYSVENLAFKVLRNTGYLDTLSDMKITAMDKILSLGESKNGIDEEAVRKKQQKFFGIVRALQKGDIKPSKASKAVKKAADSMSKKDVIDYAETDTKGLPEEMSEEEGEDNRRYKFGCLMASFDMPTRESKITSKIDPQDLYTEEPGFGIEEEPHVTILFGLHDDEVEFEDVKQEVDNNLEGSIKAKVTGISLFENEKFDVVKMDIVGEDLVKLNNLMREKFPYTNNFPDYNAHMTIAYVKPGMGKKYISRFKQPVEIKSDEIFYSKPDGDKIHWMPKHETFNRHIQFNKNEGIENQLTVMSKNISSERIFYIKDFIQFVCDNVHMEEPIHVFLRHGRDEYIHTTASYVPSENTNHINCKDRSLVDICRSIAHELTHNRQREILKIVPGKPVMNIGGEIENEADAVAGMLIKRYTHDNGHEAIYDL